MESNSFENVLGYIFFAGLCIVGILILIMVVYSVCMYLKIVWEEKHKPRRQTLTYADIVRILDLEIELMDFSHVLFGDYRTAITHIENIAKYQERMSKDGRIPKIIEKHVQSSFFEDIQQGRKTFEIRRDKDDIQTGDILVLREIKGTKETGGISCFRVKDVFRDGGEYGLKHGYCIISI